MLRSRGSIAAATASIAAHRDFPHRTPHASTRLEAVERCTSSWPGCGSYSRCLKSSVLSTASLRATGEHLGLVVVHDLQEVAGLALDQLLDVGLALGRLAEQQQFVLPRDVDRSRCPDPLLR